MTLFLIQLLLCGPGEFFVNNPFQLSSLAEQREVVKEIWCKMLTDLESYTAFGFIITSIFSNPPVNN